MPSAGLPGTCRLRVTNQHGASGNELGGVSTRYSARGIMNVTIGEPPTTISRDAKRRKVETRGAQPARCQASRSQTMVSHLVGTRQTDPMGTRKARAKSHRGKEALRALPSVEKQDNDVVMGINLEDAILANDRYQIKNNNQARTHAVYRAEVDRRMMDLEKRIGDRDAWFISLGFFRNGQGVKLEYHRLEAIRRYFHYGHLLGVRIQTLHMSTHLLNRLLHHLEARNAVSHEMVAGCIAAAWRLAIKCNEVPHTAYKASLSKGIRRYLDILTLNTKSDAEYDSLVTKVEIFCADILKSDIVLPYSVDFFDRYMDVGGWPSEMVKEYRELGHFILALCVFDTKTREDQHENVLKGLLPSELATAAVILAVKIVNTQALATRSAEPYQFYPERLEAYTGYSMRGLKQPIKAVSQLLREKPEQAEVLTHWYPTWAVHDWR
eukprot:GHVU01008145.1.p1 GENE.GHVU01008145.1~~GHVU01008145.1.p1  ORF type:complete len:449 (+),score=42.64 GHVU01008145.1:35-1348(+)